MGSLVSRRPVEIPEEIHAAVSSCAKQLRSRYRDFAEYEDIQQELYIWYLKNHRKVEAWEDEYSTRTVQRLTMKALRNAGEKYCRAEKAERSGYAVEDEFFYTIPMVADMLTLYFDPDWMAPAVNVTGETAKKPPQEGGNLMAMVADVGKAYEAMPEPDKELLARIYDGERPVREAIEFEALTNGITHGAQDRRIRRVIGRLRAGLGGPRPYEEIE